MLDRVEGIDHDAVATATVSRLNLQAVLAVGENYLNGIDYAIIALYLFAIIALGIRLKHRASASLEQYLVGGRSTRWWMLGVSGVMDFWDLSGTMIIVSFLYLLGPRGLFIEFRGGAVLVLAVTMLWTGKWRRRSGCLTGAEWMIFRFGDGAAGRMAQMARALAGIVVTVGMIAYLVKGTGLFLSMFVPISPAQCALALVAIGTVYSMLSGFYGVVIIHLLQMAIVIAAAVTIIALGARHVSDVSSLAELAARVTSNPAWTSAMPTVHAVMPAGYEAYSSLALFAGLYLLRNVLFGMGAGDDAKYFAARSDADCGKLTFLWISLISLRWPMMIGIAVLGLGVVAELLPSGAAVTRAAELVQNHTAKTGYDWAALTSHIGNHPDAYPGELITRLETTLGPQWRTKLLLVGPHGSVNPERIMPTVLLLKVPVGLRSLIVVSLMAAAMAGFGAWVNQSAGYFVHDIYQKHFRPSAAMPEMLAVTWGFITLMVLAGFGLAFSASSINDIWAWIIMGLGGGMMMPQLLAFYWQRFNGFGYTVGTVAGVATAVLLRASGPLLGERWAFLQRENYLLPLLGLVGLAAAVAGALASNPTPTPVLRQYYLSTLPFGSWKPFSRLLPEPVRLRVVAEHRRDVAALPAALVFQILVFFTPMLMMIRNWPAVGVCLLIAVAAVVVLYAGWLRHIAESDRIVADVRTLFPELARPTNESTAHDSAATSKAASAATTQDSPTVS